MIRIALQSLFFERGKLLAAAVTTAGFILRHVSPLNLVRDGWFLLKNFWRAPSDSCSLFSAFELISARLFRKYRDRYQPDVSFAFFNLIAHFQHHHWELGGSDWRHEAVFRTADRILSLALTKLQADDVVLVLNGLSQRNVRDEGLFCYRQIDPARFLRRAGIRFARVEQLMTNDAHVFFDNESDRAEAARKLGLARIGGEPAFFVELDKADPSKLFYQVSYWDEAERDAMLEMDVSSYPFFSEFAVHAQRTGAHVREGTYFINQPILPALVENSKVLSYLWPVPHVQ